MYRIIEKREEKINRIISDFASPDFPSPVINKDVRPSATIDFSPLTQEEKEARDRFYMSCALELARASLDEGEVPVGALIVRGNRIVSADFNGKENLRNAVSHAEIRAISKACEALGGWRLPGCELYVTLEPCIMCAGSVIEAKIPRVVFGSEDRRAGAFGSIINILDKPFTHHPAVVPGVLKDQSEYLLKQFFLALRSK